MHEPGESQTRENTAGETALAAETHCYPSAAPPQAIKVCFCLCAYERVTGFARVCVFVRDFQHGLTLGDRLINIRAICLKEMEQTVCILDRGRE